MTYMYEDDLGNLYTEEEARESVMGEMTWDDYEAFFQKMPFSRFFDKSARCPTSLTPLRWKSWKQKTTTLTKTTTRPTYQ